MKKQTALEWLESELKKLPFANVIDVFTQAKAMEREQMIQCALCLHNVDMSKTGTDILTDEAEQ